MGKVWQWKGRCERVTKSEAEAAMLRRLKTPLHPGSYSRSIIRPKTSLCHEHKLKVELEVRKRRVASLETFAEARLVKVLAFIHRPKDGLEMPAQPLLHLDKVAVVLPPF